MKPLLIFGLRGTLLERLHVRNVPAGLPPPDLTVGLMQVWLRPEMMSTLLALQQHCHLAIWSSTTSRNTAPLIEAVFNSPKFYPAASASATTGGQAPGAATAPAESSGEGARFKKRRRLVEPEEAAPSHGSDVRCNFEFVWSREQTSVDEFRRMNASVREDAHATLKDLTRVFAQFPHIAQPHNTILIDDTPSKAKDCADNFLWLDTCEGVRVMDREGMPRLLDFVQSEVLKEKDVRDLLPHRIRGE